MEKILTFPQIPQTERLQQLPTKKPPKTKPKPRNMTPDGRRCVRVDVGYDPATGKRIRKAFYGKTLKEANQKANEFRQAIQNGMNVTQQKQTMSQWIDTWMRVYGQKAGYSANRTQRIDAERIRKQLGCMKLTDVRQAHIQTFADSVSGYSQSTVNKIRLTTTQLFDAAISNRIILFNPCSGVHWKHSGGGTHRRLEDWEIRLIAEHWDVHRTGLWAMLMLFAGLRRGEVLALQWDDVDFENRVLHIRHGVHFEGNTPVLGTPKTPTSIRNIPILPPLYDALKSITPTQAWVCTGAQGQPVTGSIWTASWQAWLNTMSNVVNQDTAQPITPGRRSDKDDCDRYRFAVRAHDLRHTYASMLYDAEVDVKTAQKLLGHATPDITMNIYTHLSDQRQQNSIDKMAVYTSKLLN